MDRLSDRKGCKKLLDVYVRRHGLTAITTNLHTQAESGMGFPAGLHYLIAEGIQSSLAAIETQQHEAGQHKCLFVDDSTLPSTLR